MKKQTLVDEGKELFSHKITVYNFAMTLGIVVYHWQNFYQLIGVQTPITTIFARIFDLVGYIAMGIFFMMSGFLLYHGAESTQHLRRKMKSRLYTRHTDTDLEHISLMLPVANGTDKR